MQVTGFERSAGLARLARSHAGCDIIEGDFYTFDFRTLAVDAILLCGALVHVPHGRLEEVLANILPALDPDSRRRIVYLSLKEGEGTTVDNRGRRFYYWRDADLRNLMADGKLMVFHFQRGFSADGSGHVWLGYGLHHPRPRL
jgi:SAM-dependent methyltransferase